jgi:hypothetical protein
VGAVFFEKIMSSQVYLYRIPFIGTSDFIPHPASVVIPSETCLGRKRRHAIPGPRQKPCCMTTRTIFSKCRKKKVGLRNSKQGVNEQL